MNRIRYIQHNGNKILLQDFSGLVPGKELLATLDEARTVVQSQPPKSVVVLVDVTNMRFDKDSLDRMKELAASNEPYVKASTIVGIGGLLQVGLVAISRFSGRNFRTFLTREEALDWLSTQ